MAENVNVVNRNNEKSGEILLDENVYSYPLKESLIKDYVLLTLANKRLGLASTKNKKFVSGGGIKPWKQKGTGRARAGSNRSPLWKGGGTIFGPTSEKNYKKNMPKKARKAALKSALSSIYKEGKLIIIEDFELEGFKTKDMRDFFNNLNVNKGILIVPSVGDNEKVIKSTRNLPNHKAAAVNELNIIDIIRYEKILITVKANEELVRNLSI